MPLVPDKKQRRNLLTWARRTFGAAAVLHLDDPTLKLPQRQPRVSFVSEPFEQVRAHLLYRIYRAAVWLLTLRCYIMERFPRSCDRYIGRAKLYICTALVSSQTNKLRSRQKLASKAPALQEKLEQMQCILAELSPINESLTRGTFPALDVAVEALCAPLRH